MAFGPYRTPACCRHVTAFLLRVVHSMSWLDRVAAHSRHSSIPILAVDCVVAGGRVHFCIAPADARHQPFECERYERIRLWSQAHIRIADFDVLISLPGLGKPAFIRGSRHEWSHRALCHVPDWRHQVLLVRVPKTAAFRRRSSRWRKNSPK